MEIGPAPCAHKLWTKPNGSYQPRKHLRGAPSDLESFMRRCTRSPMGLHHYSQDGAVRFSTRSKENGTYGAKDWVGSRR